MAASTRRATLMSTIMPRTRMLPVELLELIFRELGLADLCCCSLVCRKFRETIKGSLILQYHSALARVGAIDGPLSTLTTAQRMARLEAQERAWLYVTPTRRDTIPIPRRLSSFDLCGGVLVGARAPTIPVSPLPVLPPATPTTTAATLASETSSPASNSSLALPAPDISDVEDMDACELVGTHLPSIIGGRPDITSWSHNVGFPIYGLTVDPSQDLAVLIEARTSMADNLRVHLTSLSTFLPHPLAAHPILEVKVGDGNMAMPSLSARCTDNMMGVLLNCYEANVPRQMLYVWDWKTGIMRAWLDSTKEGRTFDDFSFLTADTIIIPVRKPAPATLDVYKIEPHSRRSERLGRNSPAPIPFRITTLELPEFRTPLHVSINPITSNSDPLPSLASRLSSPLSSSRHQPFYLDPSKSLLSFSFMVCHGHTHMASPIHERFTLLAQREALVERVERIIGSTGKKPFTRQTVVHPWTEWGPSSSRFLVEKHLSWAAFVHGSRVIMAPSAPGDRSKRRLRVLDFNPYVVAREREKLRTRREKMQNDPYASDGDDAWDYDDELESQTTVRLVDRPCVIQSGKVFKNDVHSELPYRETTSLQVYNFANVVIDEERLAGLVTNESGDLCAVEILTM